MKKEKEVALKKAYSDYVNLILNDFPIERIDEIVAENLKGFGSTVDEKFMDINRFRRMILDQREQEAGLDIKWMQISIDRRISPEEDSAIYTDEFTLTMQLEDGSHVIPLRLSSIFEYNYATWKLVHIHGSVGVETEENDTWHKEEWKQKQAELERQVQEKTAELVNKNRELEIEAALETVRSRSLAMHHSDEIEEVIAVLFHKLRDLNVEMDSACILTFDHEMEGHTAWAANPDLFSVETVFVPYFNNLINTSILDARKKDQKFFSKTWSKKVKDTWYKYMFEHSKWKNIPDEIKKAIFEYKGWGFTGPIAKNSATFLVSYTNKSFSDDEKSIITRFGKVFEQAYIRFLDIQKAEVQTREVQIEAALEKVRSQSLAMHQSSELQKVVNTLFNEMHNLNIGMDHTALVTLIKDSKDYDVWVGSALSNFSDFSRIPFNTKTKIQRDYNKAIQSRPSLFNRTYSGKIKKEYSKYLFDDTGFKSNTPEKELRLMRDGDTLSTSIAMREHTGIQIVSYSGKEFSEGENLILNRFALVFEQAYTRFIDLQTVEAQARESEIQLSLERVRAASLAMHKSEDLNKVLATMFKELANQGLDMLRLVIWIFNQQDHDVTWWAANPEAESGTDSFHIPWTDHEVYQLYWKNWENREKRFHYVLKDDVKKSWDDYLFNHTEMAQLPKPVKKAMIDVNPVYLYNTNHNYGLLMLASGEEQNDDVWVIERFSQVFNQSYTRFLDLKKAEAQVREAQIEAALERVRAQTMAMHNSEDVGQCTIKMFSEITSLGVHEGTRFGIGILNHQNDNNQLWTASKDGKEVKMLIGSIDMTLHPLLKSARRAWKEQTPLHTYILEGDDLINYYQTLKNAPNYEYESKLKKLPEREFHYGFVFDHGFFYAFSPCEFDPDLIRIVQRFSSLFGQTYQRYLDLKKAEAQAHEAQIEAALEKVRSRSLAMHKSDELNEVVNAIYIQLQNLDVNFHTAVIHLMMDNSKDLYFWVGTREDAYHQLIHWPFVDLPIFHEMHNFWGTEKILNSNFDKRYKDKFMSELFKVLAVPDERKALIDSSNEMVITTAFQNEVAIQLLKYSNEQFSSEEQQIVKRFSKVFGQVYTRFLDLQKAEAQAREAQIEAALERIRSRSMAMHKSEELQEVINQLFREIESLGVQMGSSYIVVEVDEDITNGVHIWVQNNENLYAEKVHLAYLDHPMYQNFHKAWYDKTPFYTEIFSKREKNRLFRHLFKYSKQLSAIPDERKKYVLDGSGFSRSVVLYKNVGFVIQKYEDQPFRSEEISIQKRFGSVFEQTYTRFLDLQKAESQAREAKIEAALERVRSKAMAMHSPDDLVETVNQVFKEFDHLEISFLRCGILRFFEDRTAEVYSYRKTEGDIPLAVFGTMKFAGHELLDGAYEHWLLQKEFIMQIKGEAVNRYYQLIGSQVDIPGIELKKPHTGYGFIFPEGALYVWTTLELTKEHLQIMRRFRIVLELTYRRYIELQEAEIREKEAIKQASLDRVRGEIASMRSKDDLERITPLIWSELTILGVPFIRCGVFIMDDEHEVIKSYLSTPDGKSLGVYDLPYGATDIADKLVQRWKKKKAYKEHWDKDQFVKFMEAMAKRGFIQNQQTYQGDSKPPETLDLHFVPFKQGMLYAGNIAPLADNELELLKSLAEAFSIAYARYEDFIQLEHAKNQIESALGELKSTQTQLIHAEKMASLGELTAGIAHEIQNPLNFVNNFSEVSADLIEELREELAEGNNDEVKEISKDLLQNMEKINHHGQRASSIVKGMLEHSRTGTQTKELTDLNALADEYLRLSYHGLRAKDKSFNANFKTELDANLPKVKIFAQDMGRVFLNMINNAFYAVSSKSKDSTKDDFQPEVLISTKQNGKNIQIVIQDNGNGIPQKHVDKIFQPFFTTKPTGQGTGLGLSLSYDIITQGHDGHLEVETEESIGTRFIIEIPLNT